MDDGTARMLSRLSDDLERVTARLDDIRAELKELNHQVATGDVYEAADEIVKAIKQLKSEVRRLS